MCVGELEIVLICTPQDGDVAERFGEDLLKIGVGASMRLKKYVVTDREKLMSAGAELAAKFFNEALGLRVRGLGDTQKDSDMGLGGAFSELSSFDQRMLAECYVYLKAYNISRFPAVIINGQLFAEGKMPSPEEVAAKFGLTQKKPETVVVREEPARIVEEQEEKAEPIYVRIKPEPEEVRPEPQKPEPVPLAEEQIRVKIIDEPSQTLDEETRRRIVEILNRTKFRGPEECTSCLYFIADESRCAFLHVSVIDPKRPLCRSVLT